MFDFLSVSVRGFVPNAAWNFIHAFIHSFMDAMDAVE
jgi:hypothetical protein